MPQGFRSTGPTWERRHIDCFTGEKVSMTIRANDETDEFLDAHVPGATSELGQLRARISDLNRWHRHAPGRIRCVLITGETGVGKYELARLIVLHDQWSRSPEELPAPAALARGTAPLTRVLLTALPGTLAEAELFGHIRGAFTGATRDHSGVFGDTKVKNVLLDEIGDCSLDLQAKLLQVIEDSTYRPIGAPPSVIRRAEARIFLATRRPLAELVERGLFRDDLFYRIAPFRLHLPPLRQRASDIPVYIERMIEERIRDLNLPVLGLPALPAVAGDDLEFALRYPWPGNFRQLADAVQCWLLCACRMSFREVVEQMETVTSTQNGGVAAIVRERLTAVLAQRRNPYGKVGDLLDEITGDVRAAMYHAYHEEIIDKHDWKRVFAEQSLSNIRSAISGFGPGRNRDRSSE